MRSFYLFTALLGIILMVGCANHYDRRVDDIGGRASSDLNCSKEETIVELTNQDVITAYGCGRYKYYSTIIPQHY
jgi:hypothetical protein